MPSQLERLNERVQELEQVVEQQSKALASKTALVRMLKSASNEAISESSVVQELQAQLDANPEAARLAAERDELLRRVDDCSEKATVQAREHASQLEERNSQLQSQLHTAQKEQQRAEQLALSRAEAQREAESTSSEERKRRQEAEDARERSERAFAEQSQLLQDAFTEIKKIDDERVEEEEARLDCEEDLQKERSRRAEEAAQRVQAESDASQLRKQLQELQQQKQHRQQQDEHLSHPTTPTASSKHASMVPRPALAAISNL